MSSKITTISSVLNGSAIVDKDEAEFIKGIWSLPPSSFDKTGFDLYLNDQVKVDDRSEIWTVIEFPENGKARLRRDNGEELISSALSITFQDRPEVVKVVLSLDDQTKLIRDYQELVIKIRFPDVPSEDIEFGTWTDIEDECLCSQTTIWLPPDSKEVTLTTIFLIDEKFFSVQSWWS